MKRKSEEYPADILESIRRVKIFIKNLQKEEIKKNTQVSETILRNLEIIGEAVAQLPEEVKKEYPVVPWRDVKDFRNVVAHHYFAINFEGIWNIIEHQLPVLNK